jgi:hypothetical protein
MTLTIIIVGGILLMGYLLTMALAYLLGEREGEERINAINQTLQRDVWRGIDRYEDEVLHNTSNMRPELCLATNQQFMQGAYGMTPADRKKTERDVIFTLHQDGEYWYWAINGKRIGSDAWNDPESAFFMLCRKEEVENLLGIRWYDNSAGLPPHEAARRVSQQAPADRKKLADEQIATHFAGIRALLAEAETPTSPMARSYYLGRIAEHISDIYRLEGAIEAYLEEEVDVDDRKEWKWKNYPPPLAEWTDDDIENALRTLRDMRAQCAEIMRGQEPKYGFRSQQKFLFDGYEDVELAEELERREKEGKESDPPTLPPMMTDEQVEEAIVGKAIQEVYRKNGNFRIFLCDPEGEPVKRGSGGWIGVRDTFVFYCAAACEPIKRLHDIGKETT